MEANKAIAVKTVDREMWDIPHALEQFRRNGTEFKLEAGVKLPGEISSDHRYDVSEIIGIAYRDELIDVLSQTLRASNALGAIFRHGHAMPLYRQHIAAARQSGDDPLTFASWVRRFMTTAFHVGAPHPDNVAERLADQVLDALGAVGVKGLGEAEIVTPGASDEASEMDRNVKP